MQALWEARRGKKARGAAAARGPLGALEALTALLAASLDVDVDLDLGLELDLNLDVTVNVNEDLGPGAGENLWTGSDGERDDLEEVASDQVASSTRKPLAPTRPNLLRGGVWEWPQLEKSRPRTAHVVVVVVVTVIAVAVAEVVVAADTGRLACDSAPSCKVLAQCRQQSQKASGVADQTRVSIGMPMEGTPMRAGETRARASSARRTMMRSPE